MEDKEDKFDFEILITEFVLKYLAQLYNDDTLSKKQIQFVIQTHIDLLKTGIFQTLKQEVLKLLESFQCDKMRKNERDRIVKLFIQYENMFHGLETEHKRESMFQSTGAFIKPETYVIGPAAKEKRVQGKTSLIPTDSTAQYIPMKRVLKAFLELPGVLDKILTYMKEMDNYEGPLIENFVQGDLWKKEIKPLFNGKTVLPLVIYTDDAETAELGSHMGDNKLGMIYYTILSLPPEYQSLLKNIFTQSIHYVEDGKAFCNSEIYRPLLQELEELEKNGISVVTENGEVHRIYFALCLIIGDNLGLHKILGIVENFIANYHCRICRVYKNDALHQSQEDPKLLRDVTNYEEDVNINDYSLTGIKERCIFNVLDSYHVVVNHTLDIMHDMDEGTLNLILCGIFSQLFERKRFTEDILNDRIQSFDYGWSEVGNKPPHISKTHIKNKKLHLSASECLCLFRHLGLIIGDLVHMEDDDQDIWKLYNVTRELTNFTSAPYVNRNMLPYIDYLTGKQIILFKDLFPSWNVTAKLHHGLHIARVLREVGPLSRISCYRYESKHKHFKENARTSRNRRNLPLTLATRTQLKLCYRLLLRDGLERKLEYSKITVCAVKDLVDFEKFKRYLPPQLTEVNIVKWINVSGTKYHEGMVLVIRINCDDHPVFAQIKFIVFDVDQSQVFFIFKRYNTMTFNENLCAHEVVSTDSWGYIEYSKLINHLPTHIRTVVDGKSYVSFRHVL